MLIGAMSLMPFVSGCKQVTNFLDSLVMVSENEKKVLNLENRDKNHKKAAETNSYTQLKAQTISIEPIDKTVEEKIIRETPKLFEQTLDVNQSEKDFSKLYELIERHYKLAKDALNDELKNKASKRRFFEGNFRVVSDFDGKVEGDQYTIIYKADLFEDKKKLATIIDEFNVSFKEQKFGAYRVDQVEPERFVKLKSKSDLDINKLMQYDIDLTNNLKILPKTVFNYFLSKEFKDFESANKDPRLELPRIAREVGLTYKLGTSSNILYENGIVYDTNPIGIVKVGDTENEVKSLYDAKMLLTALKESDYEGIVRIDN